MLKDNRKENLIVTEILNKNYNPQMFYKYLESNTIKGSNLANWTYGELEAEIQRYKTVMSGDDDPVFRNTTNLDIYKSWSKTDTPDDDNDFIEKKLNSKNSINDQIQVFELITANKLFINEFFKTENIDVDIYDSTEQTSYWFMKEIFFMVKLSPMNWKVNRTFNDFILLKDSLRKSFPFILVRLLGS